jgi:hypothetical protein
MLINNHTIANSDLANHDAVIRNMKPANGFMVSSGETCICSRKR